MSVDAALFDLLIARRRALVDRRPTVQSLAPNVSLIDHVERTRSNHEGSFRDSRTLKQWWCAILGWASRLNLRDGGNSEPGQVDREHASGIREIARIDPPIVRLGAPSAEGETKTQAGSVDAALLEWAEEFVHIPSR